jgi:hypothetical protein
MTEMGVEIRKHSLAVNTPLVTYPQLLRVKVDLINYIQRMESSSSKWRMPSCLDITITGLRHGIVRCGEVKAKPNKKLRIHGRSLGRIYLVDRGGGL